MILQQTLVKKTPRYGLGTRIHQYFAKFGGVELNIPPRNKVPPSIVKFDKDEEK